MSTSRTLKALRLSPTEYRVQGESSVCTHPECDAQSTLKAIGKPCKQCAKLDREGKFERSSYQVDIKAITENGKCDCGDFRCKAAPLLRDMTAPQRRQHPLRCKHILAARRVAKEDGNFDALLATLPDQEDNQV